MRNLKDILHQIDFQLISGSLDQEINALQFDSRAVQKNDLFFAIVGVSNDGHLFIDKVIASGCNTIMVQRKLDLPQEITQILVADTNEALALAACNYYDHPADKLKLIGITGTNGKTTTTTLLFDLFTQLGYKTGLLSTVVNRIGALEIPATHTTPNPIALNSLLDQMIGAGCTYCFMEVSSHALHQNRVAGIRFSGAVFTNITHDHLDYHHTFSEYIKVKKSLFDHLPSNAFALSNFDDKNGSVVLQNTKAKKASFALKTMADFKGKVLQNDFSGLMMSINGTELCTRLIGEFNASNLLAVFGVTQLLELDANEVLKVLSNLKAVDGRFQFMNSETGITAVVDYAHTPDALENVLSTIKSIQKQNSKIITIVGCGGDRDKSKRPEMAKIAVAFSQQVILTSDNPRTENPNDILDEMRSGLSATESLIALTIPDRKQAIQTAIVLAQSGDILLIAGKGHEKYQEINGVKFDFDDYEITSELFKQMRK